MKTSTPDFFPTSAARSYDEKNRQLAPISAALHFLTKLTLKTALPKARVLSVGAGTGAEILTLGETFPEWTFVALDPSAPMLEVCRERICAAGLVDRCEFIQGQIHDLPKLAEYDVAVSFLVGHFIPRAERAGFYRGMTERLKPGGTLINAEISYDLDSVEFPRMLEFWREVQALMGATPDSLAALPTLLRETLTVLPPSETERLLREAGVANPIRFYQAFMIHAWAGTTAHKSGS